MMLSAWMCMVIWLVGCQKTDQALAANDEFYGLPCVKLEWKPDGEKKVMDTYLRMRKERKEQGYTPLIILQDDHMLDDVLLEIENRYGSRKAYTDELLSRYEALDAPGYFSEIRKVYEENNAFDFSWVEEFIQNPPDPDMDVSSYTTAGIQEQIYIPLGTTQIYIAQIPTEKPYEALAYLPVRGFVENPECEMQIAIAKKWYEEYGSIPCAIGGDTLQFYLEDPKTTRVNSRALAEEMYMYCLDIVDQGTMTLDNLEKSIVDSPFWFFWWD